MFLKCYLVANLDQIMLYVYGRYQASLAMADISCVNYELGYFTYINQYFSTYSRESL